jgi:hypothetical protein
LFCARPPAACRKKVSGPKVQSQSSFPNARDLEIAQSVRALKSRVTVAFYRT